MAEPDATLQSRIVEARALTLEWLDGMQRPGAPRGVSRSSEVHDPGAWPGVLLPGTYNAVLCRTLLGGLADWTETERAALASWLSGHRRSDGVFRIPGMAAAETYKTPDFAETWRYIDWHVTGYSLAAIEALTPAARPNLAFARPFLDPLTLKAWLSDRDLRDPWREGNNVVNLGGFYLAMRRHGIATKAEVSHIIAALFDWHDRMQEPATGFWGVNQGDPTGALHAMAGSMHNFHLFYAEGRTVPHHDRAIDYALAQATGATTACIDVDLVDLLVHGHALRHHRRPAIVDWCRGKLAALLTIQQPDGGFYDELAGVRRLDGWVRGYVEHQGLSNTFATWFRWIAIAMIADLLWPGWQPWGYRREIGIGYRA